MLFQDWAKATKERIKDLESEKTDSLVGYAAAIDRNGRVAAITWEKMIECFGALIKTAKEELKTDECYAHEESCLLDGE
jgi:hypothetical protein